jgi:hypothetical protein
MSSLARGLGALVVAASALLAQASEWGGDERGIETRIGRDRYLAGDEVNVVDASGGDVLAAAGSVELRGRIDGDAVAAGGTVWVAGEVGEDAYLAGGSVRLDGRVADAVRLVGGQVRVGTDAVIAGGAAIAGGRVRFDGAAGDTVTIAGGDVRFDGTAAGDVLIVAGETDIGPKARIDGKLTVRAPAPPTVDPAARIAGGLHYEPVARREGWAHTGRAAAGWAIGLWTAGLAVCGVLLIAAFPRFTREAAARIRTTPLLSLGVGFALLVAVPVAAVVLFATVIGIPLGLLLFALYPVMLMLGYTTIAVFLGDGLLARLRRDALARRAPRAAAFVVALVILALVIRIPYAGGWVMLLALVLGVGALMLHAARPAAWTGTR